jgi:hypothetical protein
MRLPIRLQYENVVWDDVELSCESSERYVREEMPIYLTGADEKVSRLSPLCIRKIMAHVGHLSWSR